jgi:DNA-binding NtrC family response regulator
MTKPTDVIVSSSQQIQSIRSLVSRAAGTDVTLLIAGESGTGKTLASMTIHQMSRRADKSLLQFDCAATSEEFLETELFGYEEAGRVKKGLLETANGQTFLLQNVDQTPISLQVKLLRVFQDHEFRRRGGDDNISTDCRFIGTCQGDIREKVHANLIREDFYYRLNVVLINMPPLRERSEDIIPLLRAMATRLGANTEQFMEKLQGQRLMEYFEKYSWPGNVKELRRVVEMAVRVG